MQCIFFIDMCNIKYSKTYTFDTIARYVKSILIYYDSLLETPQYSRYSRNRYALRLFKTRCSTLRLL